MASPESQLEVLYPPVRHCRYPSSETSSVPFIAPNLAASQPARHPSPCKTKLLLHTPTRHRIIISMTHLMASLQLPPYTSALLSFALYTSHQPTYPIERKQIIHTSPTLPLACLSPPEDGTGTSPSSIAVTTTAASASPSSSSPSRPNSSPTSRASTAAADLTPSSPSLAAVPAA